MSSPESMEAAEDPVVQEIPIYLSKKLAKQLFIFQYPLKPTEKGYDNAHFLKTAIKPENQEVMLEVEIDVNDANYNQRKGEEIAVNAEVPSKKDGEKKEQYFNSDVMNKIVLKSSRALPNCDNCAIGIFQNGELHVTPLQGFLQLHPEFNYLDRADKRGKDDLKNTGEESEEEEEQTQQVNVTFARKIPDHIKKMKEQSFQTQAKKSLEEQWISCEYKPVDSTQAELSRMEMICNANEDSINNLNLSKIQYLDLLAPTFKEEQYSKANIQNRINTLSYIRTLPLLDQVKIIMKDAKVMSFMQLRSTLSNEHETASILKYLQQVGVLIQGNWVVNSELVYPKDTISAHSGIPSELMCRARDYILLCFTEHEFVDRRAISSVVKLPAEEIREIFTNIAKHQPKKGWRLIVSPSKEFNERYPEIANRQELLWEAKRKQLREVMEAQNQTPQRQRRKSNRESIGSENEERLNVNRGRKSLRDSSFSDDSASDTSKQKKVNRGRKTSETSAT